MEIMRLCECAEGSVDVSRLLPLRNEAAFLLAALWYQHGWLAQDAGAIQESFGPLHCVALVDEKQVMAVAVYKYDREDAATKYMTVTALITEPAYRKNGGGSLLLRHLRKIADAEDCVFMYLEVAPWNSAFEFYVKLGWKPCCPTVHEDALTGHQYYGMILPVGEDDEEIATA